MAAKRLVLSANLTEIEVVGAIDNREINASSYFVRVYVDSKFVRSTSDTKAVRSSNGLTWKWEGDGNKVWFEPSSKIKIVIYCRNKTWLAYFAYPVGQHGGKVVGLLANNTLLDLTDRQGSLVSAKLKIHLSLVSGADRNAETFKVDVDVSRLKSGSATGGSTVSAIRMVGHHHKHARLLEASWTIVSLIYEAVQGMDLRDDSIRELAEHLCDLLGNANKMDSLLTSDVMDIIGKIGYQSLQVGSIIYEYAMLDLAKQQPKLSDNLKWHIDECQRFCTVLNALLLNRVNLVTQVQDTEEGMKEIQNDLSHHDSTSNAFNFNSGHVTIYQSPMTSVQGNYIVDSNAEVTGVKDSVDKYGERLKINENSALAEKVYKWLFAPDSFNSYNEAHEKQQANTCSWFLNGQDFNHWKANPGFLWIKGKTGSGKSILCSSIIHALKTDSLLSLAYFFFDGRDSQNELQLHNKLIRSLIAQFSHQCISGISKVLVDLYNDCRGYQQPSVFQLQDTLQKILNGFPSAYIIIDALDECTELEKTLTWISEIASVKQQPEMVQLYMIVTSRPLPDILETRTFWLFLNLK